MLKCAIEHNLVSFSACAKYYTCHLLSYVMIIYKSNSAYVHFIYMDSNAKSFYLVCSCFKSKWFHARLDLFCLLRGRKMNDVIGNDDIIENGTNSCCVVLGK